MATISYNDRVFECNSNQCAYSSAPKSPFSHLAGGSGTSWNIPTQPSFNNINIRFTLIDTGLLREMLKQVFAHLEDSHAKLLRWVDQTQMNFELKYNLNLIQTTTTLFAQINNIVARIKQFKKILTTWFVEMRELASQLRIVLDNYDIATNVVENSQLIPTTLPGLATNQLTLAKQKYTQSKTIQRQLSKLTTYSTKIRTLMSTIQAKIDSFYDGTITDNNKKTVVFRDFETMLNELTEERTPLIRVQYRIADAINKNPVSYNLGSYNIRPITIPDSQFNEQFSNPLDRNGSIDQTMNVLKTTVETIPNTTTTKAHLDEMFDSVESILSNTKYREAFYDLKRTSLSNTPKRIISNIRKQLRQKQLLFVNKERVEKYIEMLKRYKDPAVYQFQRLLTELNREITNSTQITEMDEELSEDSEVPESLPSSNFPSPSTNQFISEEREDEGQGEEGGQEEGNDDNDDDEAEEE